MMTPLAWTAHPAAVKPVRSALIVLVVSMIAGGLYQATGVLFYSVLAALVFMVTLAPHFIPTRYTIDETGITIRRLGRETRLRWDHIRTVTTNGKTVYVAAGHVGLFRRDRGILILCSDNYEQVVDTIRKVRSHQQTQCA